MEKFTADRKGRNGENRSTQSPVTQNCNYNEHIRAIQQRLEIMQDATGKCGKCMSRISNDRCCGLLSKVSNQVLKNQ